MRHLLSADQFDAHYLSEVFDQADRLRREGPKDLAKLAVGKVLACVFYEPSTRTSSSFIAAMGKLGGTVIPITQGVQFSSVSKGETLEDTIRTLAMYADAIVLRHPEVGAALRSAQVSPVPVINAGDGIGEHPTQALLDLYTIRRELGTLEGLTVALVGDLLHGRTIHSLAKVLKLYGATILTVSPFTLSLPLEYREGTTAVGIDEAVEKADVVYMTRVQKERLPEGMDASAPFVLTPERVAAMRPTARILHPLPRLAEIPVEVDEDPRAAYFRQVENGLYVRMAILQQAVHDYPIR